MKKGTKILLKIVGGIAGTLAGILILMVLAITIGSHVKNAEFYKMSKNIAPNPGLWFDYIPQGITFNDDDGYFATCGYMKDGSSSRIYTIDKKTHKKKMYLLTSNGTEFKGHTGGLQYSNKKFYLASEGEGVYEFSSDFDKKSKTIEIGTVNKVNNNSSFVFSDDEFLYVGEFARVPAYPCVHEVSFNGKTHTAIMSKYNIGDYSKPLAVYSLPDEVQGIAVTKGGIIVSRSWGVTFACYDAYSTEAIADTGATFDGAPLYFLTEATKHVPSIFFTEDIDVVGEDIISMTEGSANKYHIGKFCFDYYIFKMKIADFFK